MRDIHAHQQEAVFFTASDREESVRGDGAQRLGPVEVIAEFRGIGFFLFAIHDFRGNDGLCFIKIADRTAQRGVIGDDLGNDVARPSEGLGGGGDFFLGIDEFGGFGVEVVAGLIF